MTKYKCYDGTTVWVNKRLANAPYAQAGVRIDVHGSVELWSYNTKVIVIDPHGWLTCTGTYSATTRKHIGFFVAEYAPMLRYKDVKLCYEENVTMNIYTGEVVKL